MKERRVKGKEIGDGSFDNLLREVGKIRCGRCNDCLKNDDGTIINNMTILIWCIREDQQGE